LKKYLIIGVILLVLIALILTIFADQIFGYNLTVDSRLEDSFFKPLIKRYKPGDEIVIKMLPSTSFTAQCMVNGMNMGFPTIEKLGNISYWKYSFNMPECDTTVSFNVIYDGVNPDDHSSTAKDYPLDIKFDTSKLYEAGKEISLQIGLGSKSPDTDEYATLHIEAIGFSIIDPCGEINSERFNYVYAKFNSTNYPTTGDSENTVISNYQAFTLKYVASSEASEKYGSIMISFTNPDKYKQFHTYYYAANEKHVAFSDHSEEDAKNLLNSAN